MASVINLDRSINLSSRTQSVCLLNHRNKAETQRLDSRLSNTKKAKMVTIRNLDATIFEVFEELERLNQSKFNVRYLQNCDLSQHKFTSYKRNVSTVPQIPKISLTRTDSKRNIGYLNMTSSTNPYPVSFKDKKSFKKGSNTTKYQPNSQSSTPRQATPIPPQTLLGNPSPLQTTSVLQISPVAKRRSYQDLQHSKSWLGHPEAISSIRRPRKSVAEMKGAAINRSMDNYYTSSPRSVNGTLPELTTSNMTAYFNSTEQNDRSSIHSRSISPLSLYNTQTMSREPTSNDLRTASRNSHLSQKSTSSSQSRSKGYFLSPRGYMSVSRRSSVSSDFSHMSTRNREKSNKQKSSGVDNVMKVNGNQISKQT